VKIISLFIYFIVLILPNAFIFSKNPVDNTILNNNMSNVIIFKDLEDRSVPGVEATFLLHVPAKTLWRIITDYKNYSYNFENVTKVQVIEEGARGAIVEFWINSTLKTFHYVVLRNYEKPFHKLTWKRISGDFKTNHGSWEIFDTADTNACLVKYRSFVEVDGFIENVFKRLTIPESVKRIKRMVEKLRTMHEQSR
jgi:ribosome-associated toxin RatA of RatAB toxin-antitoxin module